MLPVLLWVIQVTGTKMIWDIGVEVGAEDVVATAVEADMEEEVVVGAENAMLVDVVDIPRTTTIPTTLVRVGLRLMTARDRHFNNNRHSRKKAAPRLTRKRSSSHLRQPPNRC